MNVDSVSPPDSLMYRIVRNLYFSQQIGLPVSNLRYKKSLSLRVISAL